MLATYTHANLYHYTHIFDVNHYYYQYYYYTQINSLRKKFALHRQWHTQQGPLSQFSVTRWNVSIIYMDGWTWDRGQQVVVAAPKI